MLINLKKTETELREQINKSLRTEIRKAEKSGLEIKYTPTNDEVHQAYQLYLKMMKKKHLPVEINYYL